MCLSLPSALTLLLLQPLEEPVGQQLLGRGCVCDVQRARRRLRSLHFSVKQVLPGTKAAEHCTGGLTRPGDDVEKKTKKTGGFGATDPEVSRKLLSMIHMVGFCNILRKFYTLDL